MYRLIMMIIENPKLSSGICKVILREGKKDFEKVTKKNIDHDKK